MILLPLACVVLKPHILVVKNQSCFQMTTAGSGLFLWFCTVTFFTKFCILIVSTIGAHYAEPSYDFLSDT